MVGALAGCAVDPIERAISRPIDLNATGQHATYKTESRKGHFKRRNGAARKSGASQNNCTLSRSADALGLCCFRFAVCGQRDHKVNDRFARFRVGHRLERA